MALEAVLVICVKQHATTLETRSGSDVVAEGSAQVGHEHLDFAVIRILREGLHLRIGQRTAESIRNSLTSGSAGEVDVKGRSVESDAPAVVTLTASDVEEALLLELEPVVAAVVGLLATFSNGKTAFGAVAVDGARWLPVGFKRLLEEKTGLPVRVGSELGGR